MADLSSERTPRRRILTQEFFNGEPLDAVRRVPGGVGLLAVDPVPRREIAT